MSAGAILTVLSNIPWTQVIDNAPKVAEAAGKLWDSVAKRNDESAEKLAVSAKKRPASDVEVLQGQVAALGEGLKALQEEMRISSQLIKDLADQNTALVQRIEFNRLKLMRVAAATGAGIVLMMSFCAFLFITR